MKTLFLCLLAALLAVLIVRTGVDLALPDAQAQPLLLDAGTPNDGGAAYQASDPFQHPDATLAEFRAFWEKGGWQGSVFILYVLAFALYGKLKPADKNGDGIVDEGAGWQHRTWAGAGAVVMVAGPILARLAGLSGATWTAVLVSMVPAAAMLMTNLNPGSKIKLLPS